MRLPHTVTISVIVFTFFLAQAFPQPNIRRTKQGYSMRVCFDNKGVFGKTAYSNNPASDSIGVEYPIGNRVDHLWGAGLWVGGKLDTSSAGNGPQVALVSTAYEGWAGPMNEFFPGPLPADTIWRIAGRNIPHPPEWYQYWGNAIDDRTFSDNDHYCTYTDFAQPVANHTPLRLKVVQRSFVWNDPYAEAIHIIEYKLINMGNNRIDSAYVGILVDPQFFGPYRPPHLAYIHTGFYRQSLTAYARSYIDSGATPVGITLLKTPRPLDSLRIAYRTYSGPMSPSEDRGRYAHMASGTISPDEFPPIDPDLRFVFSVGPFTLHPLTSASHDTLVCAFAVVCAQDVQTLNVRALRARAIYESGGTLSAPPNNPSAPAAFELFQNHPNPFNPTTTIKYALTPVPSPSGRGEKGVRVILKVYDLLGREVATLVNEVKQPGEYTQTFDATDLPSGVYFYRLTAGSFTETKRMLLLR